MCHRRTIPIKIVSTKIPIHPRNCKRPGDIHPFFTANNSNLVKNAISSGNDVSETNAPFPSNEIIKTREGNKYTRHGMTPEINLGDCINQTSRLTETNYYSV